ncbi:MAG: hypothetical protein ABI658_00090 [Acidimicrobiales bacterium]
MRASRGTTLMLDAAAPAESPLLGLENEFRVLHGTEQIDFRSIVGGLAVDGRRIDASDRQAYRCSWGGIITADGREAEIAVAPVECEPGFVRNLHGRVTLAHKSLRDALPVHLSLHGYSTHISVATPTRLTSRVASIYAQRFAAPMMLLLDGRDSPGLLVRTRPGRIELCGEYATDAALRGATAFAAGSVLASIRAVNDRRYRRQLPPIIDVALAPAAQRTGWYVDRCGFGIDLYAAGRLASLRGRRGITTAQHQLEEGWAVARDALTGAGLADDDDLAATDRMVAGLSPLPTESAPLEQAFSIEQVSDGSAFGDAIADRARPCGRISAAVMSWDVVIFAAVGVRTAFVAVPRRELAVFLADLDTGRLDDAIGRYLASPPNASRLNSAADVERASLYDHVSADDLAPNEPRPGAPLGRIQSMIDRSHAGNGGRSSRDDKDRRDDRSQPESNSSPPEPSSRTHGPRPTRKLSRGVVGAAVTFAVVVLAASVAMATRGSQGPPSAASGPTTTVAGGPGPSTISRTGSVTPSTTTPQARPVRFRAKETGFAADYGWSTGTCDNGATPGRVVVWKSPNRRVTSSPYADPPPAGVTAFEMTWVGADRYEVLFPAPVDIGNTGLEVVADCTSATSRKSGKSLLDYSMGNDIENAPIGDQPFVILKSVTDPRLDQCVSPGHPVEVKTQWGIVTGDHDIDPSTIFAEEIMQLGADGAYRVSIETRRYFDELMAVGHYETTHYRCDWGNG